MADVRLANVERYRQAFPEYGVVFVGDTGQGDVLVGTRMREAYPQDCPAVFVHDVVATAQPERDRLAALGVHVVDTYVGAAGVARGWGSSPTQASPRSPSRPWPSLDEVAWESAEQERDTRALFERDVAGLLG